MVVNTDDEMKPKNNGRKFPKEIAALCSENDPVHTIWDTGAGAAETIDTTRFRTVFYYLMVSNLCYTFVPWMSSFGLCFFVR